MTDRRLSRLSLRCRVMLIVVAAMTLPTELMVHSVLARKYYYLDVENLQLVALTAAKTGVQYLPADPRTAVHEANAYAEGHGIARAEIIFTELSSDNAVLTIRLERKVPEYFAVLLLGGLPARDISVTASARRQDVGHPLGTEILDVPEARTKRHEPQDSCLLSQGQGTETAVAFRVGPAYNGGGVWASKVSLAE